MKLFQLCQQLHQAGCSRFSYRFHSCHFLFSFFLWTPVVSVCSDHNRCEVCRLYSLLIPELMENPLWPQLPRPTWHISPYHHQESDHHHTYREERTQYVIQCIYKEQLHYPFSSNAMIVIQYINA